MSVSSPLEFSLRANGNLKTLYLHILNILYYNNLEENRGHPPRDGQEPAERSKTAGCKVQQRSVGAEVEETTETETEREGAQLSGRGQGDYIAVPVLYLCLYLCLLCVTFQQEEVELQGAKCNRNLWGQKLRKVLRQRLKERVPN